MLTAAGLLLLHIISWRIRMNSVLKATSLVALSATLIACGGDIKENTSTPQNYHDITVDLQGTVFDAVTGQRISTDGLKVTLVQGDNYRTAKTNGDFQGDYFIGNIPASANLNNITYRIIAEKDGYQTMIGRASCRERV